MRKTYKYFLYFRMCSKETNVGGEDRYREWGNSRKKSFQTDIFRDDRSGDEENDGGEIIRNFISSIPKGIPE